MDRCGKELKSTLPQDNRPRRIIKAIIFLEENNR
jgi:hypothetical protein